MNEMPLVSLILPTFNNGKYLKQAIDSILEQTYQNLELIVIDDGSSDNTQQIIRSYTDPRIVNLRNETNLGLIKTLNIGLAISKGKYIARMDGDDISFRNRILTEVNFLEENPEVVLIGGSHLTGDLESDRLRKQYFPLSFTEIKAHFLFNNPFSHITVMFRRQIINKYNLHYEEAFKYAEDYALWLKFIDYGLLQNLPIFFAKYRSNPNGQTSAANSNSPERFKILSDIQFEVFKKLGYIPNDKEKVLVFNISETQRLSQLNLTQAFLKELETFFGKIITVNNESKYTSTLALKYTFGKIYIKLLTKNIRLISLNLFFRMIISKYSLFGLIFIIKQKVSIRQSAK